MSGRELAPEPEQWRRVHPLQEARPLRQLGARALFQTSDKVGEAENKVKVYYKNHNISETTAPTSI